MLPVMRLKSLLAHSRWGRRQPRSGPHRPMHDCLRRAVSHTVGIPCPTARHRPVCQPRRPYSWPRTVPWILLCLCGWLLPASPAPVLAQSDTQLPAAGAFHLYLLPDQVSGIDFLTHIVEVRITEHDAHTTQYSTVATYRVHNTQQDPQVLTLTVQPLRGTVAQAGPGQLRQLMLYRHQTPIPLASLANGQYQGKVVLEPDERDVLALHYTVHTTDERYFSHVQYDVSILNRWGMPPDSMRVSVFPDLVMDGRNLQIGQPATYQLLDNEIHWHFENALPTPSPRLQFIHKRLWNTILEAEARHDLIALGQHYHTLYTAAAAPEQHRRVFYDQALAAFLQGVAQDPGQAHYGLARLYRTRLLSGTGTADSPYLELVLHHAHLAFQELDPDLEAQRQEVVRWLVQGLELRVALASRREDWTAVNDSLDAIQKLPVAWIGAERIEEIRRNASLQQAIRLLDTGATEEAMILIGAQIREANYLPDPEALPLFAGWRADVQVAPDALDIQLQGTVRPAQAQRLAARLETLAQLARQAGPDILLTWIWPEPEEASPEHTILYLDLSMTSQLQAQNLGARLSADTDLGLLRHLLLTPWLYATEEQHLFFADQTYEYELHLEEVFRLWRAKAQTLEQHAVAEASAGADSAEAVVRQFTLVNAAHDWRELIRNTAVFIHASPESLAGPGHVPWVATAESPHLRVRLARRVPHQFHLILLATGLAGSAMIISWGLLRLHRGHRLLPFAKPAS